MPNPVLQPTESDIPNDISTANFVGVLQRNRNFETMYQAEYQLLGLTGTAGRQQDRNHYRVYFKYEYSTSLLLSLAFSRLILAILASMARTFEEP